VDNLVLVEVVNGVKHLLNCLGSILFGKFPLFANSLEELSAGGKLGNNIELVLHRELQSASEHGRGSDDQVEGRSWMNEPWTQTNRQT
jgi:hypothetical protein